MTKATNNTIKLSSGVILKTKRVNPFVIYANLERIQKPKIPRQYIESKGREEENPAHPDYLEAMEKYESEQGNVTQDTLIALGTELASCPEGFSKPDETEWADALEASGMEIPANGRKRYVSWVRFWAIQTPEDMVLVARLVAGKTGTPETEVARAAESFRRDP